ncbi:hypothetical protein FBU59_004605 [Linderina macrospora]|uniref:Uncharacterized protein n=1 Tax=Linderina macrospora TaxID=4868 RepID=A0ACC1J535_9FUNG|nr:hypothetical protein FBU59_004605 [Linderina macrospora]
MEAQQPQHPYFPRSMSMPHYQPSQFSAIESLLTVGGSAFAVGLLAVFLIGRTKTPLTCKDKFVAIWMMVSAGIHMVLEGYFVYHNRDLAGMQTVMADLWREYSHSDSRYLTSDPFTVIMEGVTAVCDGPFAALTAYGVLTDSPVRYVAQLIVSVMQLYGNVLYMLTNAFEGFAYSNPHPYYFYGYFVFMNAIWVVIPIYLIHDAWTNIYRGMLIAKRATTVTKKSQ